MRHTRRDCASRRAMARSRSEFLRGPARSTKSGAKLNIVGSAALRKNLSVFEETGDRLRSEIRVGIGSNVATRWAGARPAVNCRVLSQVPADNLPPCEITSLRLQFFRRPC